MNDVKEREPSPFEQLLKGLTMIRQETLIQLSRLEVLNDNISGPEARLKDRENGPKPGPDITRENFLAKANELINSSVNNQHEINKQIDKLLRTAGIES